MLLTFSGCGEDNSWDGKTGLNGGGGSASNSSVGQSLNALYTLIKTDSSSSYSNSLEMIKTIETLESKTGTTSLLNARDEFKKLILSYKRVETYYIAGYNDEDMYDLASFYMEQFIKQSKNYDVVGSLDAVFAGNKSLVTNDLKGITALEYTLFGSNESLEDLLPKMNEKRISSALIMAKNISKRLKSIDEYYKNDTTFSSSSDGAISATLNVLTQEAFNLREWRIGEPAGYTLKFKDSPLASRLEYHNSVYSSESIKEILRTHRKIIDTGLKNIATLGGAASEVDAILIAIGEALVVCNSITPIEYELENPKTKELYELARTIENNYKALIIGINFKQDIVEADGD